MRVSFLALLFVSIVRRLRWRGRPVAISRSVNESTSGCSTDCDAPEAGYSGQRALHASRSAALSFLLLPPLQPLLMCISLGAVADVGRSPTRPLPQPLPGTERGADSPNPGLQGEKAERPPLPQPLPGSQSGASAGGPPCELPRQ